MKCQVYVVIVVAVIVCNVEGGGTGTSASEASECPVETGRQTRMKLVEELKRSLSLCLDRTNMSFTQFTTSIKTQEGRRSLFKNLCESLPVVKRCLAEESKTWEGCHNETLNSMYSIFVGVIETSFTKGCLNDGETLAIIADGIDRHANSMNDVVRECMVFGGGRWTMAQRSPADIATKILITHKEMRRLMDCLIEFIQGDDTFISVAEELMNETTDNMKCIHPVDRSLVLCKTIDESLIDRENVCPLKTPDASVPLSLVLEARTTLCLIQTEPYTPQLSDAYSIEEFRAYFSRYCGRWGRVLHCFNETTMAAGICLNDAEYKDFKLVRVYLNQVFNAGCFEEGRRLATMFYTAKALKNSTAEKDALLTCLTTIKSARNQQTFVASERVYQYYQELPIARKCMIDNIQGNATFVADVNEFTNEVMSKMKCANPEDGAIVPCNTLDSN